MTHLRLPRCRICVCGRVSGACLGAVCVCEGMDEKMDEKMVDATDERALSMQRRRLRKENEPGKADVPRLPEREGATLFRCMECASLVWLRPNEPVRCREALCNYRVLEKQAPRRATHGYDDPQWRDAR